MACYGAATSLPWASIGLRLPCGPHCVVHGRLAFTVHGPQTQSVVDRVHTTVSFVWFTVDRAQGCAAHLTPFPLLSHGGLHAGGERPVSLASDAGARLMRVKALPSLGVLVGGVNVACGVP